MQINGPTNIQSARPVNQSNKSSATEAKSATTSMDTVDQLDISSEAQMMSQVDASDIRADRVAEIRSQIESGQYETQEKLDAAVDRLFNRMA